MLVATTFGWQVLGTAATSDTDRDAMRVEAAAVRGDVQSEQVWYTAATSDTERAVHEAAAVREGAAVQRGVRSERVCVEATSDTERAVMQEGAAVLLKSAASDADRTDSKSGPPLRAGHLSKR